MSDPDMSFDSGNGPEKSVKIFRPHTSIHGHYICDDNSSATQCLLGFHGYGETAQDMHGFLQGIPFTGSTTLAAVQALHSFYHQDHRKIGASWMTSFDRDVVIADNNSYIHNVLQDIGQRGSFEQMILCGFSQGASLVYRAAVYLAQQGFSLAGCIAVGGDIPPEITADDMQLLPELCVLRGERDSIMTAKRFDKDLQRLQENQIQHRSQLYQGGHVLNDSCGQMIANFVDQLR
ncbi:MAG: hypothetical protein HRU15_13730 [Planctomycetes bacterium]|nr:hypothetical protein [Planctomycetota bacterium]